MKITKQSVGAFHWEALDALKELAARHGVVASVAGGNFTAANFILKFSFSTVGENGMVQTPEVDAFKQLATLYGFQPDDIGRTFQANGDTYRLIGLKPKAHRMPVLAERIRDGRKFKFPHIGLAAKLEATHA